MDVCAGVVEMFGGEGAGGPEVVIDWSFNDEELADSVMRTGTGCEFRDE